jgi:hypothetical protein
MRLADGLLRVLHGRAKDVGSILLFADREGQLAEGGIQGRDDLDDQRVDLCRLRRRERSLRRRCKDERKQNDDESSNHVGSPPNGPVPVRASMTKSGRWCPRVSADRRLGVKQRLKPSGL